MSPLLDNTKFMMENATTIVEKTNGNILFEKEGTPRELWPERY